MSAELQHSQGLSDPKVTSPHPMRLSLIKPFAFFIAGLSIAFSGGFHVELGFDRVITGIIFAVLAIAQFIDWRVSATNARAPLSLITVGILASAIAAVLQLLAFTPLIYAIIIAAWGVITGVCEILTSRVLPEQRGDRKFLGVLAILMAILIGVFAMDPIAVIGFFGAYAVIAGVFVGISIFDMNAKSKRVSTPAEDTASKAANSDSADVTATTTRNESTA